MKKSLLLLLLSVKLFSQDGSSGMNAAMLAGNPCHDSRPAQKTGGGGAALAAKAGYTVGITTGSMIAATAAVALITLAALLVADTGHAH